MDSWRIHFDFLGKKLWKRDCRVERQPRKERVIVGIVSPRVRRECLDSVAGSVGRAGRPAGSMAVSSCMACV